MSKPVPWGRLRDAAFAEGYTGVEALAVVLSTARVLVERGDHHISKPKAATPEREPEPDEPLLPAGLGKWQRRILLLLLDAERPIKTGRISDAAGSSNVLTCQVLRSLADRGLVRKVGPALWEAIAADMDAEAA